MNIIKNFLQSKCLRRKNLVDEIINYEKKTNKKVLFIHLSSDAVYPYNRGNNKEFSSSTYNYYGYASLNLKD